MEIVNIFGLNQAEAEYRFKKQYPNETMYTVNFIARTNAVATLCKTDDYPQKGTRKWVTKYFVYEYAYKTQRTDGTWTYFGMKKVAEHDEKTPAVKDARDKTIATHQRHTIRIVKVLEDAENIVTDFEPKCGDTMKFQFTY